MSRASPGYLRCICILSNIVHLAVTRSLFLFHLFKISYTVTWSLSRALSTSPNKPAIVLSMRTLKAYEKRTKKDLLAHPLAAELRACNSPSAIRSVLQQQVPGL
jgi:hypothetical protein